MNLNALWNPVGVNGVLYSRVLPAQNQVDGNYDAFAYLGLGVLIALPIAVVLISEAGSGSVASVAPFAVITLLMANTVKTAQQQANACLLYTSRR